MAPICEGLTRVTNAFASMPLQWRMYLLSLPAGLGGRHRTHGGEGLLQAEV